MSEPPHQRGLQHEKNRDYEAAAADFELAAAEFPADAQWRFRLGLARERLKQLDLAIAAYVSGLELDGSDASWHLRLARLYERQGQLDEAVAAYEQALERDGALDLSATSLIEARQVLRLWRFVETSHLSERGEEATAGRRFRRHVLSSKFGRKVARTVSRVELAPNPDSAPVTLIEKTYAWPEGRSRFVDIFRHAELLFYTCRQNRQFRSFVIPELVGMFTTAAGVVLLLSDQRSLGSKGFRATRFRFDEAIVGPLLRAICEFNLCNPLGGHEALFDTAAGVELETDRTRDYSIPWPEIARAAGLDGAAFLAGAERFRSEDDAIVTEINVNGKAVSHNDIAPGNLLTDKENKVAFIDFENVRLSAPGFDIGDFLVFLIRSNLTGDRLPDVDAIAGFHTRMVERYVEAATEFGRALCAQSVYDCSVYAFVLHMLTPPKAIRSILAAEAPDAGARTTIVRLLARYMEFLQVRLDTPARIAS